MLNKGKTVIVKIVVGGVNGNRQNKRIKYYV